MNVSLTPELERWIAEQVETGDYQTNSEVVREALRRMKRRGGLISDIQAKLAEAEEDIQAGRVVPMDEHFIEDIVRRGKERSGKNKVK